MKYLIKRCDADDLDISFFESIRKDICQALNKQIVELELEGAQRGLHLMIRSRIYLFCFSNKRLSDEEIRTIYTKINDV